MKYSANIFIKALHVILAGLTVTTLSGAENKPAEWHLSEDVVRSWSKWPSRYKVEFQVPTPYVKERIEIAMKHSESAALKGKLPNKWTLAFLAKQESFARELSKLRKDERSALDQIGATVNCPSMYCQLSELDDSGKRSVTALSLSSPVNPVFRELVLSQPIGDITKHLNKLKSLEALFMPNLNKEGFNFRELNVHGRIRILEPPLNSTDADLLQIKNLEKIQWLKLVGCYSVNGSFILNMQDHNKVEYIDFRCSGFNPEFSKNLDRCRKLKWICVTNPIFGKASRLCTPKELLQSLKSHPSVNPATPVEELEHLRSGKGFPLPPIEFRPVTD